MKKTFIFTLVVLLVATLFISCTDGPDDTITVTIKTSGSEAHLKQLTGKEGYVTDSNDLLRTTKAGGAVDKYLTYKTNGNAAGYDYEYLEPSSTIELELPKGTSLSDALFSNNIIIGGPYTDTPNYNAYYYLDLYEGSYTPYSLQELSDEEMLYVTIDNQIITSGNLVDTVLTADSVIEIGSTFWTV